jgi:hypothetical protein
MILACHIQRAYSSPNMTAPILDSRIQIYYHVYSRTSKRSQLTQACYDRLLPRSGKHWICVEVNLALGISCM